MSHSPTNNHDDNQAEALQSDNFVEKAITVQELTSQITAGLQLLVVAIKNCALYPTNSSIRRESMNKCFQWLSPFLEEHEALRFFIDPDSLLFQGQVVHQDKPGEPSLIFPLFRDGVQWLEFQEGLTSEELEKFIILLNSFRILREEDENDLVTAMWDYEFQGLKYKTANEFWDIDPVSEIAALSAGQRVGRNQSLAQPGAKDEGPAAVAALFSILAQASPGQAIAQTDFEALDEFQKANRRNNLESLTDSDEDLKAFKLLELSQTDRDNLNRLTVKESEPLTLEMGTAPVFEVLIRLKNLRQCGPALSFLAHAVKFALADGSFTQILSLIEKVEQYDRRTPRLEGLSQTFYSLLATDDCLEGLISFNFPKKLSPQVRLESMANLERWLTLLAQRTVPIKELINLSIKSKDKIVSKAALKALASVSDNISAETALYLINSLSTEHILELIDLVKDNPEKCTNLLSGLSRHPAPSVRQAAAPPLLRVKPELIANLPHLLNEIDPALSNKIHAAIGFNRNHSIERALMSFLVTSFESSISRSETALLNCYRSLGFAANSENTVNFLSKVLNGKSFMAFISYGLEQQMVHRAGAAMALTLMGRGQIAEAASRSFFKAIRSAARRGLEEAKKAVRLAKSEAQKKKEIVADNSPSQSPKPTEGAHKRHETRKMRPKAPKEPIGEPAVKVVATSKLSDLETKDFSDSSSIDSPKKTSLDDKLSQKAPKALKVSDKIEAPKKLEKTNSKSDPAFKGDI
ncbi:MAG: hypothetical protein LBV23_05810 [Deltaproteobacteria bacterium]|jgi:hypothetical protein|nr:hypothetical protein [Deltaproteobacteria bacterium]